MAAPKGNKNHLKHGMRHTPLYHVWRSMKGRCYNQNDQRFHVYGARGITVCDEWKNDFQAFFNWAMSNGYKPDAKRGECTIDRIDVNGNYEPSNCRWSDARAQANNKTNNRIIFFDGESMTMADFCRKYSLNYKQFAHDIKKGIDIDTAMKKELMGNGK
jgi:hypothetical protein